MSDDARIKRPDRLSGYMESHRPIAIALLNLAVWLAAIFAIRLVPDSTAGLVSGATVLSAALGAFIVPNRPRSSILLTAISGIVSTALILSVYAYMTGFRLGMKVGGVGSPFDAIATFTAIYLTILMCVYAVDLISKFLRRDN